MLNRKGQGLIEYLILVCLVSVAAIAVVSVVGQNVRARFANISSALHGKKGQQKLEAASEQEYKIRGFDDFNESSVGKVGGGW